MTSRANIWIAISCLTILHLTVLFASFVSPYDPVTQHREFPLAPPTQIHFVDAHGHFHFRPFVYLQTPQSDDPHGYTELRDKEYPVRFFVSACTYKIIGSIPSDIHFFAVDAPAQIFIAGTDDYGRDQFSRILQGGQISLAVGLLATSLSLCLGLAIGLFAGFYGGWIDELTMRSAELFLVLPWLYVLLAVRAFLPLHASPAEVLLLLVAVIGTIGWARPARLIRGVVLSVKNDKYIIASRGFGASDFHILWKHVLPHTYGILLTQAALLVPQYIAAESALSFLGLGLGEPTPSWGSLLANLQRYSVMVSCWWMFAPAIALVSVSLGYLCVANALEQKIKSE